MVNKKELAFKAGELFNEKITSSFWSSFKGELGRIQAAVLVYFYDHKKAKANELVEALNIPKQHISKIITEFVENGFLVSKTDEKDKRARLLNITDKGKRCIEKHFEVSNENFDRLFETMDSREQKQFLEALETIKSILEKY